MRNHFKKNVIVVSVITILSLSYTVALAQTSGSIPPGQNVITPQSQGSSIPAGQNVITPQSFGNNGAQTIVNPLQFSTLQGLLNGILDGMITIGTIALTAAIIWIGFTFVTARGDPGKLKTARMALLWTVIGGLILLGAKGIETVIQSTVSSVTS